jgi:hypothetical protein
MGPLGLEYHPSAPISYPSLQEIGLKKYFPWVQKDFASCSFSSTIQSLFLFIPQNWSLFGQHFEVALIGDNLSFPELEESLLKRMKGGKPDFAHRLFLRKSPFPHIAKLVYL